MHRSMNFVSFPMFVGATNPNILHTDICLSILFNNMKTPAQFFKNGPIFAVFKMAVPLSAQKMEGHRRGQKEQNILLYH